MRSKSSVWLSLSLSVLAQLSCGDGDEGAHGSATRSTPPGDAAAGDSGNADSGKPSTPATGTFPAVTDLAAAGPYTAMTVSNTGPDDAYTLYYPTELAPGGVRNPVVSWGNGGGTVPGLYPMLPHLATHGFVVIAPNSSYVTGPMLRAGLDWLAAQNDDASNAFHDKLDVNNAAGLGYSFGGLATYGIADDPRLVTVVIISGANMMDKSPVAKLHTPTAYFCTDDDASRGNCDGDFAVATVPAFYGVMKGTAHVDIVVNPATVTRVSKVTTGWLRWQLMQDSTQKAAYVGANCGVCQDAEWNVMQKNLN